MNKILVINNQTYPYEIKKSRKAKRARISVNSTFKVIVTVPWWSSFKNGERMMQEQQDWLTKTLDKLRQKKMSKKKSFPPVKNWQIHKFEALKTVEEIIKKYSSIYPYNYKKITIKNLSTRWGSCSIKKNLNFHYRIVFLLPEEAEYLVVHELCHLKEMNHSKRFWDLVAKTFPEFKKLRKALHGYSLKF